MFALSEGNQGLEEKHPIIDSNSSLMGLAEERSKTVA